MLKNNNTNSSSSKQAKATLSEAIKLRQARKEFKEAKDTLKPLQKLRIDQLNWTGFNAYCLQDGKGKIYPKEYQEPKEQLIF
jgi:hypothetical protein